VDACRGRSGWDAEAEQPDHAVGHAKRAVDDLRQKADRGKKEELSLPTLRPRYWRDVSTTY
jgi:hypothetical protein